VKLLLDMNLSPRWLIVLREGGWDCLHWSGVGSADAPDAEIMSYAATNDMVVVTHDLDFGAILAVTHGKKPSVVLIRSYDINPDTLGKQTLAALNVARAELEAGALLIIEPDRQRLRLLPLGN
jgi:predicted nuclease of predicted toxin-antitoxin system